MKDLAKLRRHRELGTELLGDFMKATPETAAELVEREGAWMRDLIPLVEPHGDAVAARFEPITLMRPEEFEVVIFCVPLDELFNRVRMCHATRLYRLENLFQQLSTVPRMVVAPARKTGRHPGHGALDDVDAVAEMERLVATGMAPWSAAIRPSIWRIRAASQKRKTTCAFIRSTCASTASAAALPETSRIVLISLKLILSST